MKTKHANQAGPALPTICVLLAAVYRFQQVSDIVYRLGKQQQQQGNEEEDEQEAQSVDLWLLTDSTLAQLMDPQLAAPAVQFLVLEVPPQCSVLNTQHRIITIAVFSRLFGICYCACTVLLPVRAQRSTKSCDCSINFRVLHSTESVLAQYY